MSVSDNDAVIPTSIIVNLDGVPVPAAYDSGTGNISYQPAGGIGNMINTGAEPLQPAYPDIPLTVVHDLMPLHKIEKGSCNECHSIYLTREHNRLNSSGVQMTCATCHSSSNPAVQLAIATKNRDCLACHTQADHEAVHNGGLDANCQTCHSATLSVEHLNNSTTAGKNYSCDTCHTSTAKEVKRTIAADSLNCAGCHQEGHNLYFVDKVPADIPLYSGFWALPIEAAIFAGEPSAPADYDSGQVVMSNRQTDLTAANIWTFYNLQLGANGWTLNAGAPAAGADYFAAEFVKGGRYVTVKCFNTENSSGAGQPVSTGYRLEIWYK